MKKDQIILGHEYTCKVSGKLTTVKVIGHKAGGGFYAVNVRTGRDVQLRSAARLRGPAEECQRVNCVKCKMVFRLTPAAFARWAMPEYICSMCRVPAAADPVPSVVVGCTHQ